MCSKSPFSFFSKKIGEQEKKDKEKKKDRETFYYCTI